MSRRVRIPAIGKMNGPGTTFPTGQDTYNSQAFHNAMFVASRSPSGKTIVYAQPRYVLTNTAVPSGASGNGTAVISWASRSLSGYLQGTDIVSAFGNTTSTVYKNSTSAGAVTGLVKSFTETKVTTTPFLVFPTTGNLGYYYDGTTLSQITSANFPSGATHSRTPVGRFVAMDGYNLIMSSDGAITHSDVNSLANWSADAWIKVSNVTYLGRGILPYGDMIVAFTTNSTHFLYNAGNAAGSKFNIRDGVGFDMGIPNEYACTTFNNTVAFVGVNGTVTNGVYVLDGVAPKKISTTEVDLFLQEGYNNNFRLHTFLMKGKIFLGLNDQVSFPTLLWVYDPELDLWASWTTEIGITQTSLIGVTQTLVKQVTYAVGNTSTVYATYTDAGSNFATMTWETAKTDFGTMDNKSCRRFRLICDKSSSSRLATVQFSKDDYENFSTARTLDLISDPAIDRLSLGKFRNLVTRVKWPTGADDGGALRLEGIEFYLDDSVT